MNPMSQETLTREPVFIDLETRSACDLPRAGGWNYADDPTTHLLTVAWSPAPDEYHVWFPWHPTIREDYIAAQQSAHPAHVKYKIHVGHLTPDDLRAVADRPWAAHNAWNFDALVWSRLMPGLTPPTWVDTEPLARAVGLPGGLDAIGKRLWGEGKYLVAKHTLKKQFAGREYGDAADVPVGLMPMIAQYNVQDVVLLRGLWGEIVEWLKMPQEEWDVLETHRVINDRGCAIDQNLMIALIDLTNEGRDEAVKRIAEITKDDVVPLKTINDIQSPLVMKKWLDTVGMSKSFEVRRADGRLSVSLKKELVQNFIEYHSNYGDGGGGDDEPLPGDDDGDDIESVDDVAARERARTISTVVRVLQLRSAALRITGGKLASAASAVCADGRVRGLFVYAGAHTLRWAGRRVQVQNLPRPKQGIKPWEIFTLFERTGKLKFAEVDALLPDRSKKEYRYLTPDDASSALIRMILRGDENDGWQDADDPLGLLTADLSNIEARVLAWLAGEKWLMDTFWAFGDPYVPMAEVIYGPWQSWPGVNPDDPKTAKKHTYRQPGKVTILGAGYQMSGDKLGVYAMGLGVDLAEMGTTGPACILAYRRKHPMIAGEEAGEIEGRPFFRDGFWHKLQQASISALVNPGVEYTVGVGARVTFVMEGKHLMVYLPSGRRLVYREARIEEVTPPYLQGTGRTVPTVVYTSARYGRVYMYGGKWAENIVQAVSRDFLAAALVRLEALRLSVVLHVHDEGVSLGRISQKAEFMRAFTTLPAWAANAPWPFPLDAEGGWTPRYAKSPPPGDKYKEELWRNGEYVRPA